MAVISTNWSLNLLFTAVINWRMYDRTVWNVKFKAVCLSVENCCSSSIFSMITRTLARNNLVARECGWMAGAPEYPEGDIGGGGLWADNPSAEVGVTAEGDWLKEGSAPRGLFCPEIGATTVG